MQVPRQVGTTQTGLNILRALWTLQRLKRFDRPIVPWRTVWSTDRVKIPPRKNMRAACRLSVLAVMLVAANASAVGQKDAAHPDLSGTWVFNSSKSQPAEKVAKRTETLEIGRLGQSVRIRFLFPGPEQVFMYVPDGNAHVQQDPNVKGESHTLVAQWIGSTLVTDRRTHMEGARDPSGHELADIILVEHWDLSSGGRVLTRLVDQLGGNHLNLVYDRQPSPQLR
jgi:hypothetical protein